MNKTNQKIKDFTDLFAWQEGHKLALLTYKITDKYPKKETFSLIDQMRRAAVSVTSNIAEGFGRQSYKEKIQFYYLAQGSLIELKNQLILSKDVGYLGESGYGIIKEQIDIAHKLLQGLIKSSKLYLIPKS